MGKLVQGCYSAPQVMSTRYSDINVMHYLSYYHMIIHSLIRHLENAIAYMDEWHCIEIFEIKEDAVQ